MLHSMIDTQMFKWSVNLSLTVPIIVAINKVDKPKVNVVCWFIFESFYNNIKGLNHLFIIYNFNASLGLYNTNKGNITVKCGGESPLASWLFTECIFETTCMLLYETQSS